MRCKGIAAEIAGHLPATGCICQQALDPASGEAAFHSRRDTPATIPGPGDAAI
ncbi:hypothetical protein ASZ90_010060 [hydrocarbon metagenome]|uniref:Uncharacterized protein n=1 Tax=hydrocarbon metagenome TaxID=938273 RepID=A0A0W8FH33_9ZZZZ